MRPKLNKMLLRRFMSGGQYPFFAKKMYVQSKHKGNKTKTKSMKPKMLKTLNMNQFYASWSSDLQGIITLENQTLKNSQQFVTVNKI